MPIEKKLFCAFCSVESVPKFFEAKERMFGTGGDFNVAECGNCGSIQLLDVPQDLSIFYPNDYYAHQSLVISSNVKNVLKKLRYRLYRLSSMRLFRPFFGEWLDIIQPNYDSKIADIGCGNGQLLHEMYAAGFTNLHGFDPFIVGDKTINGSLRLYKKEIFQIEDQFDLIMMHHAFEHMDRPGEVLAKAYQLMKKGGCLLIRIPVADAEVWKKERANWVQLDAPRHLFVPTVEGLTTLAKKVGFPKPKVVFDSSGFQFWGTELYKKGVPLIGQRKSKYFSKLQILKYNKKAQEFNALGKGDQACFYFFKL